MNNLQNSCLEPKPSSQSAGSNTHEVRFYWRLAGAKDIEQFRSRVLCVVNELGFSDIHISHVFAKFGVNGNVVDSRDNILDIYREKGFYLYDFALQHCEESSQPILTSTIEKYIQSAPFKTEQIEQNLDMIKLNKGLAYHDAYHIPFPSHEYGGNFIITLTARGVGLADFTTMVETQAAVLHLLAEVIAHIADTKFSGFLLPNTQKQESGLVSQKRLKLLAIMAKENLKLKEAAVKLCISLDTANKHIASIKSVLGANTTASAVYYAIKRDLISLRQE